MYKKLLTKKFFKDNPHLENSVQRLIYSTLVYEDFEEEVNKLVIEHKILNDERLKHINQEKALIEAEENPKAILNILRKETEMINRVVLIKKALEFEEILLPMVLEKLVRSYNEIFIENSIDILARSNKNYSPLLKERYAEIRSPYTQSLVCLVIGFRGTEDTIPWMLDKFYEMKKTYPNDTYDQGPLLALHELKLRFYKK
ncbi:hypothetical protein F8154_04735 [Alkaliphilus pronyensis]|uniref:Uncharacterized protein n=1 Tax=Alkaliphilus pronyensis TaxID=1482732 RepID=A0A6I0F160_9FIRM|nr:hypothetical protein [Alkaliphilus pronyensis]KAB3536068.1 hypothetical protein F8154_04735 [Alkaliphilus pronyensis]